jgi:cellulose synthase/poly-beta-1,6-N-acetylglucosamine synthase-like glycosyltransferase
MVTARPQRASAPVLVAGLGSEVAMDVVSALSAAGFPLRLGSLSDLAGGPWSLVVCTPALPGLGGLQLLTARGGSSATAPVLLIGRESEFAPEGAAGLPPLVRQLAWPFDPEQLVGTVEHLLAQPGPGAPEPASAPEPDLLGEARFRELVMEERDEQVAGRSAGESFLVSLRLDEWDAHARDVPPAARQALYEQLEAAVRLDALPEEKHAVGDSGDLLMLLPSSSAREASARLKALSAQIASTRFDLLGQAVHFSPAIGYTSVKRAPSAGDALVQAREAATHSARHLDLQPALYRGGKLQTPPAPPGPLRRSLGAWRARHQLWIQYLITTTLGLVVPFLVYWALGTHGMDISDAVYIFVVVTLALTALSIWAEGFLALRRADPPDEPAQPYPPASAVIAAYLPNEAPIIEDTIRAFLRVQYPASLQVILAYNTPKDMPEVEERLRQIARENPRFVPMRVPTSTSKAQNVNAALASVTGAFCAVFDADHQPDPDSFRRAWRWISHGADVVQGHCFIRNGDASWVARMVAIEFEQIYAVSHPGRARLHGFGIFGGSNGYWRTPLLRELRMHGFMLTEDIDSSLRAVLRGRRIVSDPYLVSRELAPETMQALAKQRLRWAQGWLQISMKWVLPALRSRQLTLQQKLGMLQLLGWREAYPWVSMQILPLIAWWAVEAGSLSRIDWFVPLFVVTTLFTLGTGPGQIYFTYRLADAQLKRHKSWFWFYLLTSTVFYSGVKNAWNRIAHWKELRGETAWVVTTRAKAKT